MNKSLTCVVFFVAILVGVVAAGGKKASPPLPKSDCDICETLVLAIEGWLEENKTVSQIEQDIETICMLVPAFEQVCDAFVEEGVVEVIKWIENEESPATVCTQLGLCSGHKKQKSCKAKQTHPLKNYLKKLKDENCLMCETLIQAIESWLEDNMTIAEIQATLDTLCELLPVYKDTCEAIVQQELVQVIQWIENNETPQQVCTQLGLCTNLHFIKPHKPTPKPQFLMAKKPGDTNCLICEYLIEAIEQWVENNDTIEQIEQNLETLCALIPGYQKQCDAIIETEIPTIVQWLEKNEDPQTVCQQIGFCNNARKHMTPLQFFKKH
jgi:saposin